MTTKQITVNGVKYHITRTKRFRTSYGYAGSKGIQVTREDGYIQERKKRNGKED